MKDGWDKFVIVAGAAQAVAWIVCILVVASVLSGCEECAQNETRCRGDRAEMCSSGGDWTLLADCAEIEGAAFACCADPAGGYSCLLATECAPDAGAEGGTP